MNKTRPLYSEQTEIVKLKTNYLLNGDFRWFTVSLPIIQGLFLGFAAMGGINGVIYFFVLMEKIPKDNWLFLQVSGWCAFAVAMFEAWSTSKRNMAVISEQERETVTTTPVVWNEEDTQQEPPDSPPIIGNRRPYIYFPVGDDFKPLTTEQRTFFRRYKEGEGVVREDLQNSPAYKNKGLNISVNYPAFVERLKEAGILDANNSLTTFGVEWAKGE